MEIAISKQDDPDLSLDRRYSTLSGGSVLTISWTHSQSPPMAAQCIAVRPSLSRSPYACLSALAR